MVSNDYVLGNGRFGYFPKHLSLIGKREEKGTALFFVAASLSLEKSGKKGTVPFSDAFLLDYYLAKK